MACKSTTTQIEVNKDKYMQTSIQKSRKPYRTLLMYRLIGGVLGIALGVMGLSFLTCSTGWWLIVFTLPILSIAGVLGNNRVQFIVGLLFFLGAMFVVIMFSIPFPSQAACSIWTFRFAADLLILFILIAPGLAFLRASAISKKISTLSGSGT
jgi:hypothetical protein